MKVLVLHIVVMCPKLLNHAYTVPLVTQPSTIPNSPSLPFPASQMYVQKHFHIEPQQQCASWSSPALPPGSTHM